jgi:hypothetical protein
MLPNAKAYGFLAVDKDFDSVGLGRFPDDPGSVLGLV